MHQREVCRQLSEYQFESTDARKRVHWHSQKNVHQHEICQGKDRKCCINIKAWPTSANMHQCTACMSKHIRQSYLQVRDLFYKWLIQINYEWWGFCADHSTIFRGWSTAWTWTSLWPPSRPSAPPSLSRPTGALPTTSAAPIASPQSTPYALCPTRLSLPNLLSLKMKYVFRRLSFKLSC